MSVTTDVATTGKKTKAELAEQISFTSEQLALMKNTVAKGATDDEFMLLLHLAKTYGLDPFAKEIWCIKYLRPGQRPEEVVATIFSSRDGYLKIASRDKQMNGLVSDAVCANDTLHKLVDGTVEHTYGNPRGAIIGAYALVFRKDRSYPAYFYASFAEYGAGNNPTWKKYPSAMIIKVAEAMALKRAFSISGLVTQEEIGLDMQLPDAGTGAELVQEPAPMTVSATTPAEAELPPAVEGAPLSPRTKKLITLAVEAYDADAKGGPGYGQRLLDSLRALSEEKGTKILRWLEVQPKRKAATVSKTTTPREASPASASELTNEFRVHPTADDRSPVEYATAEQKEEINRLCRIPAITVPEKTTLLLNINRLDTFRADDAIAKLTKAIEQREGGAGVAAAAAAA